MSQASGTNPAMAQPMPMARKLAYRNLFHDRMSLFVTLVGIVFSVVLVAVQCGLYLGSEARITAVLDHVEADLWVVPVGTKSFDDPTLLPGREKHAILSTPGVASVEELLVSFVLWRKLPRAGSDNKCATDSGLCGSTTALLIGSDTAVNKSLPWDLVQGTVEDLSAPNAVAVDTSYFSELGVREIGDRAEIVGTQVTVRALTKGIRSFTTLPYVFTTLAQARTLVDASPDQASYMLVRVAPGSNIKDVRDALRARLKDAEVIDHQDFRERSTNYWLFETGAGTALIAAAVLAVIVGVVVVAQTLYASTKEHLNEFATLRALGASSGFIRKVILWQAVLSAIMGYVLGIILSQLVIYAFKDSTLLIVMTFNLAWGLLVLTIAMCVFAAISAIFKVIRIDPAVVFSR
jgi:putative ABC transport system permease protein